MENQTPEQPEQSETKSTTWIWIVAVAAAVVIVVIGAGAWFFFIRDDAPEAVDSETAISALEGESSGGSETTDQTSDPLGEGNWVLDTSIGSFEEFTNSFVGYRIGEELAGIGGQDAVGRTPEVSGSLDLEGTTVSNVEVEADMTALESDDSRRDGQLTDRGLETDEFQTASFELSDPIQLDTEPADGATATVTAKGRLTLHGVTNDVDAPVEAQLVDNTIVVTGSFDVALADYDIEPPTGFRVLSIQDTGTVEFQLFFSPR